jgi:hypothetical protein
VLGGGVEVLVNHLLQSGHQRFIQRQRFCVLYALDISRMCARWTSPR